MEGSPSSSSSSPVNPMSTEPAVRVKRYKALWRVFLVFNFALGAYMFAQPGKKERGVKEKSEAPAETAPAPVPAPAPAPATATTTTTVTAPPQEEELIIPPPITRPVIVRQPVPEDQQREIFKWMLEEKRKVKPLNREEKKRLDEEKAILKEFIRSESVPRI